VSVVVTGAAGFLGWHVRCALRARGVSSVVTVDRSEWADRGRLDAAVSGAEVVLHLAGANRGTPDEVGAGNEQLATSLVEALGRTGTRPSVVYADSIQSGNGTAFGTGKRAAAEVLLRWGEATGSVVTDVRLPNLFGEHGRPHYNSVVATFCHQLARGERPKVEEDREVPLLHVQDAVDRLLDADTTARGGEVELPAYAVTVSALLHRLTEIRDVYATGEIPDLTDPFDQALFNTYRSFAFPANLPFRPPVHADERGDLFECVRVGGGQGQVFCSTTRPGQVRGEHFHRRKVERFVVVGGTAVIALRRLFDDRVVRFEVSGEEPAVVDMPTLWAHSITNTGSSELTTLFWASELHDPEHTDTYPEAVGT
jgi:UDP-2-acetamido-2,6-beta-L-arabino-hexul-4-ose reductase